MSDPRRLNEFLHRQIRVDFPPYGDSSIPDNIIGQFAELREQGVFIIENNTYDGVFIPWSAMEKLVIIHE